MKFNKSLIRSWPFTLRMYTWVVQDCKQELHIRIVLSRAKFRYFMLTVGEKKCSLLISSFILSLKVLVCILEQRKWSKDKIRLWLKLSHSKGQNEQCLWSHTATSTSWSYRETSRVILGNQLTFLRLCFFTYEIIPTSYTQNRRFKRWYKTSSTVLLPISFCNRDFIYYITKGRGLVSGTFA